MQGEFVTASVKRFEALAHQDRDLAAVEPELFALADKVRREPQAGPEEIQAIARSLDALAHESEVPAPGTPDAIDQGAPLRCAGVMRRAADLLRGPEKDLTPPGVSGGAGARPGP